MLFEAPACGFPPPLNYESNIHNGKQPVRYERQKLRIPMEKFGAMGDWIHVVDIHWITGQVIFFQNVEEALNGIACGSIKKFRIYIPASVSMEEYIHETLALLKRGHSLMHPQCTCYHTLCPERCRILGISHPRSDYNTRRECIPCPLTRRPREFTSQEISEELGVDDIGLIGADPEHSLLAMLQKFCHTRMEERGNILFSSPAFNFDPLHNMDSLLQKLSCNPLPQCISLRSYPEAKSDISQLEANGQVYVLQPRTPDAWTLFYLHPRWDIGPIDEDLVALWHSVDRKDIKQELARIAEPRYVDHWLQIKKGKPQEKAPVKRGKRKLKKPKRKTSAVVRMRIKPPPLSSSIGT